MSGKRFYITTAIDYTNAAPHLGHAYEKVLADVINRYQRLRGRESYLLTGVDQHGQKVQMAAQRAGLSPAEFARRNTERFRALWHKLDVRPDGWAETTDPRHRRVVRRILEDLHGRGQLYRATHAGYYSVRQEQFLTDKERDATGEFGPEWGEVVHLEEENWYFRLSEHRDWLARYLEGREDAVEPGFRRQELLNAVARPPADLCISRPRERLAWGIDLPFDPGFVTYVWFDALINYITFAGYDARPGDDLPEFGGLWPADCQLIGKDILVPAHGIYWLSMLHAIGFADDQMPRLVVHGFWNMGGSRMSKSVGNVVDPDELAERYGVDALRYYLMRDIVTGRDAEFAEKRIAERYNAELANNLGNLLNRTLTMAQRYRGGALAASGRPGSGTEELEPAAARLLADYTAAMACWQVHAGLEAIAGFASACNGFAERAAPWKLAREPGGADRLDAVLCALAEATRVAAVLLSPVLPGASARILQQLGLPAGDAPRIEDARWGGLPAGHRLGEPSPVFPRIEGPPAPASGA